MKGQIVSRKGDQLKVLDSKSGSLAMVVITYDTKILRDKSKAVFRRHEDMDVNAMLPGRTISAEGVGDPGPGGTDEPGSGDAFSGDGAAAAAEGDWPTAEAGPAGTDAETRSEDD